MTKKAIDPLPDNCVICDSYELLPYKDLTLGSHGFCQDCLTHVISADFILSRCGLKDPPPGLVYHGEHRLY